MWCDELYLVLALQIVLVHILVFSCFNYSKILAISFIYERKQVSICSPFLSQAMRSVILFNSINSISDLFQRIKSSSPCKQPHPCKIGPWILPFVNWPGIPTGQSKPRLGNRVIKLTSLAQQRRLVTSLFKTHSHLEFKVQTSTATQFTEGTSFLPSDKKGGERGWKLGVTSVSHFA